MLFSQDERMISKSELKSLLREFDVPGVSVSVLKGDKDGIESIAAGFANKKRKELMREDTFLEIASLSKSFAACFAVKYFREKGITLDYRVNTLLEAANSPFRLRSAEGTPSGWGDEVRLRHLLDHSGLGMHYVNGVPLSKPFPPVLDLITGKHKSDHGYEHIYVHKKPGSRFGYSGGGFLVLQHLLESWENGRSIDEIIRPFLKEVGVIDEVTFAHQPLRGVHYATGHRDNGEEVEDGRLMFPPLAAGGLGTARSLCMFLQYLGHEFSRGDANAIDILRGQDRGCMEFMGTKMGLGVFVADAGPNRFAIHQAANDGFRGVYVVCFDGPGVEKTGPRGFAILNNGDNRGTLLNCAIARRLLERMECRGVDFSRVADEASLAGVKQEEIVNAGLKQLVFGAFVPRPRL